MGRILVVAAGVALVASLAVANAAAATSGTLTAKLSGAVEVPGPGDPDGTGRAALRLDATKGEVCYELAVTGITLPAAAAHIHLGASGVAGPILVPLTAPDASGASSGCATGVAATTVQAMLDEPAGFYVNVHTSDYPAGAVRGTTTRGPITFTLVERGDEQFGFVDNPPKAKNDQDASVGDFFAFSSGLHTQASGGTRAGSIHVVCVVTKRRPGQFHCTGTIKLRGGSLSLSATTGFSGRKVFVAITGGTGIYQGASGLIVSTEAGRYSYDRFTIFLP